MGKNKTQNLQPWLDWFDVLRVYCEKGFLEVLPEKGEAYVTEPAFYTLADIRTPDDLKAEPGDMAKASDNLLEAVRRVKVYCDYLATATQRGVGSTFALHVVEADAPHDLRYTVVMEKRRRWWWPWRKMEEFSFVYYSDGAYE